VRICHGKCPSKHLRHVLYHDGSLLSQEKITLPYPVGVVNNLVFNFFLPVTKFYSIIEIQTFQPSAFLRLVVFSFGVLLATCVLTFFVIKPFHLSKNVKRTFILGASYTNQAFLGFPVAYAFLGDKGVVLAIFYAIGGYFFLYVITHS
jgi:predicted permease